MQRFVRLSGFLDLGSRISLRYNFWKGLFCTVPNVHVCSLSLPPSLSLPHSLTQLPVSTRFTIPIYPVPGSPSNFLVFQGLGLGVWRELAVCKRYLTVRGSKWPFAFGTNFRTNCGTVPANHTLLFVCIKIKL